MKNDFLELRTKVSNLYDQYMRIRKDCEIEQVWNSETIQKLVLPFINGSFTLAIVGKAKAGKSTFINSIIGTDLLPTGLLQTTSSITTIEYGEEAKLLVQYADGHSDSFIGEKELKKNIHKFVTVPPKYTLLPIYHINMLIEGEDTLQTILQKKDWIDKQNNENQPVSESIWKEYVKDFPKHKIVKQITITYPLPPCFSGWRIIDTPGVGAVGGLQDETKKWLSTKDENGNNKVDAILFLHSGTDNIEDSVIRNFVENTSRELTKSARERMFLVITKAAIDTFRNNKEEIINKATELFSQQFNIAPDRILYVDSLLHKFVCDYKKHQIDYTQLDDLTELEGWNTNDLEHILNICSSIRRELIKRKWDTEDNQPYMDIMEEWSNYASALNVINHFVKETKKSQIQRIEKLIFHDIECFLKDFKKRKDLLEKGLSAIEFEKSNLNDKQIKLNQKLSKLRKKYSTENINNTFDYITEDIRRISDEHTIEQVNTAYLNIIDKANKTENELFEQLVNELRATSNSNQDLEFDIALERISFSKLEADAEKASTREVEDTTQKPIGKRLAEGGGWKPKRVNVYPKIKITNPEEKLRKYKAHVLIEAKKQKSIFLREIDVKTTEFLSSIANEYAIQKTNLQEQYNQYMEELKEKNTLLKDIDSKISIIEQIYGKKEL